MIPIDIQVRRIYPSLKFKCRDRNSNPGPVGPQAKRLTISPPPLPSIAAVDIITCNKIVLYKIRVYYTPSLLYPPPPPANKVWVVYKRKGRDLTQPYDRSPYTDRNIQKAT